MPVNIMNASEVNLVANIYLRRDEALLPEERRTFRDEQSHH